MYREWGEISTERAAQAGRILGAAATRGHWLATRRQIQSHDTWRAVLNDPAIAHAIRSCMGWAMQVWGAREVFRDDLDTRADGFRWQARLALFLAEVDPDDRSVIVFVDEDGDKGKSRFAKWMACDDDVCMALADDEKSTTALYSGEKTVLFDVARSESRKIQWHLIENIKNGLVFQTKYEVLLKLARWNTSHVVMFMNHHPPVWDKRCLSRDRWHVITDFSDRVTLHELFPPSRWPAVAGLTDPFDDGTGALDVPVVQAPSDGAGSRDFPDRGDNSPRLPSLKRCWIGRAIAEDDWPTTPGGASSGTHHHRHRRRWCPRRSGACAGSRTTRSSPRTTRPPGDQETPLRKTGARSGTSISSRHFRIGAAPVPE